MFKTVKNRKKGLFFWSKKECVTEDTLEFDQSHNFKVTLKQMKDPKKKYWKIVYQKWENKRTRQMKYPTQKG